MNVPVTGAVASMLTALGCFTLAWYFKLPMAERAEADRLAIEYARQFYGKAMHQLTSSQMSWIHDLVKARVGS